MQIENRKRLVFSLETVQEILASSTLKVASLTLISWKHSLQTSSSTLSVSVWHVV